MGLHYKERAFLRILDLKWHCAKALAYVTAFINSPVRSLIVQAPLVKHLTVLVLPVNLILA